jgi:transmembrane sensor
LSNVLPFVHPHKLRDEMREQASALLARLDADPGDAVTDEVNAWLAQDPAHVEVFLEMAALWDEADVLGELSTVFPLREYCFDFRHAPLRNIFVAVAVSLAVAAIGIWITFPDGADMESVAVSAANTPGVYETRVGEQSVVVLDDGSQLILNTNSRLRVEYSPLERKIFLERGESHFVVAKDASRPFRVNVGNRVIEAVGTAFTVHQSQTEDIEVTVTEGKVKLLRQVAPTAPVDMPAIDAPALPLSAAKPDVESATSISLTAGEYAAMSAGAESVDTQKLDPAEIEVRLAWRHGMLLFQDEPLSQVLEEVSRYTSVRIEADESVRNILVGGYFRTGDIEGLLTAMQENFHIDVQRINEEHVILRAL